ncbi:homeobox protein Nkx-6.3 [Pelomyxa schiedti]|nr:homeobox protein Nkx-6.3 [Pelomyxa schiedti]
MAAYSESVLLDKFNHMNGTQESIQTLSHWICFHRKRASESAHIWNRELFAAQPDRKLLYLYLANDVLQNSRRKGPDFIKEFGRFLPDALAHVSREVDPDIRRQISRIVQIWEDRSVFPPEFIRDLRSVLGKFGTDQRMPSPQASKHPIAAALMNVEATESMLQMHSDKYRQIPRTIITGEHLPSATCQEDIAELAQALDDAIKVTEEYSTCIDDNISQRMKLASLLSEELALQQKLISDHQIITQDLKRTLSSIDLLKPKMKHLYETLPQRSSNTYHPPSEPIYDVTSQPSYPVYQPPLDALTAPVPPKPDTIPAMQYQQPAPKRQRIADSVDVRTLSEFDDLPPTPPVNFGETKAVDVDNQQLLPNFEPVAPTLSPLLNSPPPTGITNASSSSVDQSLASQQSQLQAQQTHPQNAPQMRQSTLPPDQNQLPPQIPPALQPSPLNPSQQPPQLPPTQQIQPSLQHLAPPQQAPLHEAPLLEGDGQIGQLDPSLLHPPAQSMMNTFDYSQYGPTTQPWAQFS